VNSGLDSNVATVSFTINGVNDFPEAYSLTPASLSEDMESLITLSYNDADGDTAVSCTVSSLSQVTESTACFCSAGICEVGITGNAEYSGAASFNFTVNDGSVDSNSALVSLTINPVD